MRRAWELPNFVEDIEDGPPAQTSEETDEYRGLGERLEPFMPDAENPISTPEQKERRFLEATYFFYRGYRMQESDNSVPEESPSEFCRICRDNDNKERYISPCNCKGTLELVHRTCLERWLAESDTSVCELCGFQYTTVRTPRYGIFKSIALWVSRAAHRDLLFDAIAFGAFTPLAILGTYLGINAGRHFYHEIAEPPISRLNHISSQIITLGLVGMMVAVDFSCTAWLLMRLQYHATQWYTWWRRNCMVRLQLTPEQQQPKSPLNKPPKTEEKL